MDGNKSLQFAVPNPISVQEAFLNSTNIAFDASPLTAVVLQLVFLYPRTVFKTQTAFYVHICHQTNNFTLSLSSRDADSRPWARQLT